ncbi:MAG: DciA family protein [Salegentibacter mishustinae]|nr:DciA family protein [Salegentibacter mishustinae]
MPNGFKSLADVFKTNPGLGRLRKVVKENDVVENFLRIFPQFKNIVEAKKVSGNTLTLKIENAAWRNELKIKESDLIEKINNHFNEKRINHIRFIS